jgi:hypothetical protein
MNQKTFIYLRLPALKLFRNKSFLSLFFKKEMLPSVSAGHPATWLTSRKPGRSSFPSTPRLG